MKINEKTLIEMHACKEGVEMFRRYPGLEGGCAELGALCRWAASEGEAGYVHWLLPRLMPPEGAVRWAILTATQHCTDAIWNKWADGWLSGEDRTPESAEAAAATAVWAASWAAWAAWAAAAAWTARAAAWAATAASAWEAEAAAAWAAEYDYASAEDKTAEIERQITDALEIIGKENGK